MRTRSTPDRSAPFHVPWTRFTFGAWLLLFAPPVLAGFDALNVLRTVLSALMLWPLVYWRATRAAALILLVTIGTGNVVHVIYFHQLIDEFFIATALRTNRSEGLDFLSTLPATVVVQAGTALAVLAAAAWIVWRHAPRWRLSPRPRSVRRLFVLAVALWLVVLGWASSKEPPLARRLRHVYPLHIADGFARQHALAAALFEPPRLPSTRPATPQVDTVVVVLGESASAARWSLLGYSGADTNAPLRNRPGLVAMRAIARGFTTAASLPYLLTGMSASESVVERAPSFLDLAHSQVGGYKTFVFSNSRFFESAEDFITQALRRSADVFKKVGDGSHDEVLTGHLAEALRDPAERKLIVLHTYGSHTRLRDRYPARFQLSDDYDSTIHYTSELLGRWIDLLDRMSGPRTAALFYTSDHGLVLPPCANEIRHGAARTSAEVPLLVWSNAALRAQAPAWLSQVTDDAGRQAEPGNARLGQMALQAIGFPDAAAQSPWPHAVDPSFRGMAWAQMRQGNACM